MVAAGAFRKSKRAELHDLIGNDLRRAADGVPVAIHIAADAITAFTGYRQKLDVQWRYTCRANVEMFDVDMSGQHVLALAQDRLYWVKGRRRK